MPNLNMYLHAIVNQTYITCPKEKYTYQGLTFTFGNTVIDMEDRWLIPCTHKLFAPASSEQMAAVEEIIGYELPEDFREFLQMTNGAQLYVAPLGWKPSWSQRENFIEYLIYSSEELITLNRTLLQDFRIMLGKDPDFQEIHKLNYLAFCDAHDGNYLAILLEGPFRGMIFYLDKEYLFRPYSEIEADFYYIVTQSFGRWMRLVADTKGTGGFGEQRN